MSRTDARTPVIVGAGQVVQRPGTSADPADVLGPIELMVEAAVSAGHDAGAPALLQQAGWIGVVGGFWRYRNPGQLVGQRLGAPTAATALSVLSGTSPQDLVGVAAERIASGQLDVALVVGGEARWSSQRLTKAGVEPRWVTDPGEGEAEVVGGFPDAMLAEARTVMGAPATAYALFEDSLRRSLGRSVDEHREVISELWARFSAVAATNPYAWDREAKTVEEILEVRPDNRMVAFPYTKAHVANNTVDMASAVLVCSLEAARAAGIPADRMVFPHAVTSSHDTWLVAEREQLHELPGLAVGGRAALSAAGIGPDQLEHVDLYACFPAIVGISAKALGLDGHPQLTLTGGLGFAGAPVANSSGHGLAALVPRVRDGGWGLVHANGGNGTKHAFGVYSASPPERFVRIDCEDQLDLRPRASAPDDAPGTVEAATVVYDREGPTHVLAAVRTPDDARSLRVLRDPEVIDRATTEGLTDTRL
jgi:acetyl-CoA C-acetyltransferase